MEWLSDYWKGKDKQESLLRLFAELKLIEKLKQFNICEGNFNKANFKIRENVKSVFYDKKK